MKITDDFDRAAEFLFSRVRGNGDTSVVCVEHKRFIPCRPCMYGTPASVPYSDDPVDVARVRAWQNGGGETDDAKSPNTPEPAPIPNGGRAIWDAVIADMRERDESGYRKYGTRLQAFNGRDALVDAYQEALDLCVYLRQRIEEERATK